MNSSASDPASRTAEIPSSVLLTMLMWLGIITSLLMFSALLLYVRSNDSNHTGFEPWLLGIIFTPTAVLGLFAAGSRKNIRTAILAAGVGLGGIGYLTYLDSTNRLVQYERWIDRGMPSR